MNVLLINHYAGSPDMGMEFRPYYLAREWIKSGHNVHIIAADFSHLRQKNPIVERDFTTTYIDGIAYHWVKTGSYEGNGVARALTMFRFVGKLYWHAVEIAEKIRPDVVIASSTYPLDTFAAQRMARISGAKLIHEIHDMWPASPMELGHMSKYHPFIMLMQWGEDSFCRNSDVVVSLLSEAESYLREHGLAVGKFACIPNGVVLEDWNMAEDLPVQHKDALEELSENYFLVGYFGGHALSNALDYLLDAAALIEDDTIKIVLVGDGVDKERLVCRAEQEKISNVIFLPSVQKKSIPNLASFFDCGYLGSNRSSLYRFGMSYNKQYDYMMAGLPIISSVDVPVSLTEKYNCGVVATAADPKSIAEAILKVKNMPREQRRQLGENGRKAVYAGYSYEILAKRFADLFE